MIGGEEEVDRLSPWAAVDDELEERSSGKGGGDRRHRAIKGGKKGGAPRGAAGVGEKAGSAASSSLAALEAAPRRRYLAYDGFLSAANLHAEAQAKESKGWSGMNHVELLAAALLHLVALAAYTGRTLVLPLIEHDGRYE